MCRLLEVARSGYYEWRSRPPRAQGEADQPGEAKVQHYFAQGRGTYGTRRMKYLLAQEGLQVSRRRIGRVLPQAGLRCKTRRRFKAPTASGQAQAVAPNQLKRAFTVQAPDRVYVGDITYLPTGEGWLYLAVVLDLCSRAVVGVVDGQPYAGGVGEPSVIDGTLSAAARCGVDYAYGPGQPVWG